MDSVRTFTGPRIGDALVWSALVWDDRPPCRSDGGLSANLIRKVMRDEFEKDAVRRAAAAVSPVMTKAETAAYLKVSPDTIERLSKRREETKGELAKARVFARRHLDDKLQRYHRAEIDAWLLQS